MGKPITLSKWIIRYNGLFDFDGLYALVTDWAKNYGFIWLETKYKHKVPSPKGAEQEISWKAEKTVTDYVKYEINIEVHTYDCTEVEVESEGKKKPLTNGRIAITIQGKIIPDWQEKFSGSKFVEKIGKVYAKLFMGDIESIHGDTLHYRILNLHSLIKKYFDMQSKKHAYKGYLKED